MILDEILMDTALFGGCPGNESPERICSLRFRGFKERRPLSVGGGALFRGTPLRRPVRGNFAKRAGLLEAGGGDC